MMYCGFYCYFLRRIQFADYAVVEMFEEAEGRNPGQTSLDDLPKVLKLRKEVLEKHVMCYFVTSSYFIQTESNWCYILPLQSLNESLIPASLLERLVAGTREFPPVCAIIGGILGQVKILSCYIFLVDLKMWFWFAHMYKNVINRRLLKQYRAKAILSKISSFLMLRTGKAWWRTYHPTLLATEAKQDRN